MPFSLHLLRSMSTNLENTFPNIIFSGLGWKKNGIILNFIYVDNLISVCFRTGTVRKCEYMETSCNQVNRFLCLCFETFEFFKFQNGPKSTCSKKKGQFLYRMCQFFKRCDPFGVYLNNSLMWRSWMNLPKWKTFQNTLNLFFHKHELVRVSTEELSETHSQIIKLLKLNL